MPTQPFSQVQPQPYGQPQQANPYGQAPAQPYGQPQQPQGTILLHAVHGG